MSSDQLLITFVQLSLHSGSTVIRIPVYLLESSSAQAQKEVRQLCALNGVEIEVTV